VVGEEEGQSGYLAEHFRRGKSKAYAISVSAGRERELRWQERGDVILVGMGRGRWGGGSVSIALVWERGSRRLPKLPEGRPLS